MFAFFNTIKRHLAKNADSAEQKMQLWNLVGITNPETTQRAEKHGRKFVAICAQAQRQRATEVFGPYGKSWGLRPGQSTFSLLTKDLILFQGEFFYTWQGSEYSFPSESSIAHSAAGKNGRPG